MSNDQGKGGSPTDDRTILDPLNAEELKALREARERFQKNAKGAIGPDAGEDLGDAPTRSVGALPAFDKPGPALSSLGGNAKLMPDPKPLTPQGARIAAPGPHGPPPSGGVVQVPGPAPHGPGPGPGPQQGFGENTLMWMAPVKVEQAQIIPERGAAAASGMIPTIVPPETKSRKLMRYGIAAVMGVVVALGAAWFMFGSGKPGSIELTTNPPKAEVWIDGKSQTVTTPMKATLRPGPHTIQLKLAGFQDESFTVEMEEGGKLPLRHIELTPISNPGLMTVSVEVQPVAANITINDSTFNGKKMVKVANLDPNKVNKIVVEAGGYAKIENEIPAGSLKGSYNFILQSTDGN